MTAPSNLVHRYPYTESFQTSLSIDDDIQGLLRGLTSHGVIQDVLRERHGMVKVKRIKEASTSITVYMKQGIDFLDQARSGPSIISFLPLYFAFLQFAKAYVVARRGVEVLGKRVVHGLSYDPTAKASQSIVTESIKVYGGLFELYYEELTGQKLPKSNRADGRLNIQMKNVYPFVLDSSFEYGQADRDGHRDRFFGMVIHKQLAETGTQVKAQLHKLQTIDGRASPLLASLTPIGNWCGLPKNRTPQEELPTYLLYYPLMREFQYLFSPPMWYDVPRWSGQLHYPEEIPLFIAFFHLGSIVRYKPNFMKKIVDSSYLPFLLATERHSAAKMCLLVYNSLLQCSHFPQPA